MPCSSSAKQCSLCSYFSPSLSQHVSHLRLVHSQDPNFFVKCGIEGCSSHFSTFAAFSTHIYRHHRSALGLIQTEYRIHQSYLERKKASLICRIWTLSSSQTQAYLTRVTRICSLHAHTSTTAKRKATQSLYWVLPKAIASLMQLCNTSLMVAEKCQHRPLLIFRKSSRTI